MEKEEVRLQSPLALAFLGDAVFELYARSRIVSQSNCPVGQMHKKSVELVNAGAQSEAFSRIETALTEEELAIYKRGRNANGTGVPKHADAVDYRRATGLEALFGYLYLNGEFARIEALFALAVPVASPEEG